MSMSAIRFLNLFRCWRINEWCDSQKRPDGDFRTCLQERLVKTSLRRNLAKGEATNLAKLDDITKKLNYGGHLPNRLLQFTPSAPVGLN